MKAKVTYKYPIGPVECDEVEITLDEDLFQQELIDKLNNHQDIVKIDTTEQNLI